MVQYGRWISDTWRMFAKQWLDWILMNILFMICSLAPVIIAFIVSFIAAGVLWGHKLRDLPNSDAFKRLIGQDANNMEKNGRLVRKTMTAPMMSA